MASIQTLERRIAALEARLADVEGGYGESIYKIHRRTIGTDINVSKIMNHLGIPPATDEEIDDALENEQE